MITGCRCRPLSGSARPGKNRWGPTLAGVLLALLLFVPGSPGAQSEGQPAPDGGGALQPGGADRPNGTTRQGGKEIKPPPPTHEKIRLRRFRAIWEAQGRLLFRHARELHSVGNSKRALELLEHFLILYPGHPWEFEALREAGDIHRELNRSVEAVRYYIQAFRHSMADEKGALAYLQAGRILAERGRIREARAIFDEIIHLFPESRVSLLADIEKRSLRFLPREENGTTIPQPSGEKQNPVKGIEE